MFFRYKKSPSGKILQLLESYRNQEGLPRQRVVLSVGDAAIAKEDWELIAKGVEKHLYGRQELFSWDYSRSAQKWIDLIVRRVDLQGRWRPLKRPESCPESAGAADQAERKTVDGVLLDEVDHENSALLGPVLLARHAWEKLRIDECLEELGFNSSQRLAAAANIINRLVDPVSEHALPEWIVRTALVELFGEKILHGGKDRFYRVTDKLLFHQKRIQTYIRRQHRQLFSLNRTLFLYDLTNTYFEGKAERNRKAKRGKSKHKRDDCPQIVVGMVFDEHGFELGHEIFEGNRNDSTTLVDMVKSLQKVVAEEADLFNVERPLVIVDSGIATRANRKLLREAGFSYLVNDSRTGRKTYREEFLKDEGFTPVRDRGKKTEVKVRVIEDVLDPDASEGEKADRLVLCKSEGRREKELAIRSSAENRFLEALGRLARRVEKGRLKDKAKIERAIGRIQAKHPRVAGFYTVEVEEEKPAGKAGSLRRRVVWHEKDKKSNTDEELLGCYVLRTDSNLLCGEELWRLYMTLTRAEDGFRSLKRHLGLRPIRHHIEPRGDAHVFITILAYHLLRTILQKLESAGDTRNWETIKRVLSTHCYATVIVPTQNNGTYRIRKAGKPDEIQKAIYRTLGANWKNLPVITEHILSTSKTIL